MLYLEDYLEMIEHLPQELRDRFTEMRELDLAVQNNMDSLDKKARLFFQQCKRGDLQHESMDTEFHSLRGEYFKVMEDADEKVAIATQIHELVERYLRRLDSELFKFKCELEADNNGITEILEKRSLELDGNNSTAATALLLSITQKENRYYNTGTGSSNVMSGCINSSAGIISSTGNPTGNVLVGTSALSNLSCNSSVAGGHHRHRKLEKRRETICTVPVLDKRINLSQSMTTINNVSTCTSNVGNTTNHVNGIATHVTLPIPCSNLSVNVAMSSNIVRQLPTAISANSVLSSNTNNASVTTINSAGVVPSVGAGAGVSVTASHGNTTVSYNLQQLGGGAAAANAIAVAASQAIVATQQMQQGRRTASLKASFEAIHGAGVAGSTEFWSAAAAHNNNMQPVTGTLSSGAPSHQHQPQHQEKKHKKKFNSSISMAGGVAVQSLGGLSSGNSIASSSSSMSVDSIDMLSTCSTTIHHAGLSHGSLAITPNQLVTSHTTTAVPTTATTVALTTDNSMSAAGIALPTSTLGPAANLTISDSGVVVEQTNEGEWSYDPNEPRYCTCNQVSYGDMVACDNDACPYEWFHYPCVGITQPPKGKWYCPKCTASMRRRGNRKN